MSSFKVHFWLPNTLHYGHILVLTRKYSKIEYQEALRPPPHSNNFISTQII